MSAMPKIHDLDADLDDGKDPTPRTAAIRLFGQQWDIKCDVNSFSLMAMAGGDAQALTGFLRNIVIDDQQSAFVTALTAEQNLSVEKLSKIVSAIVEVASARPTKQPSDFKRPAKKRASVKKSTARSSAPVRRPVSRI